MTILLYDEVDFSSAVLAIMVELGDEREFLQLLVYFIDHHCLKQGPESGMALNCFRRRDAHQVAGETGVREMPFRPTAKTFDVIGAERRDFKPLERSSQQTNPSFCRGSRDANIPSKLIVIAFLGGQTSAESEEGGELSFVADLQ